MTEDIIAWSKFIVEESEKDDNVESIPEEMMEMGIFPLHSSRIYDTLLGPIDLDNPNGILHHFNLWLMDCNFNLTKSIVMQLSNIEGVEVVHIITPYKCVVGFGKLFKDTNVKLAIENNLIGKHRGYILIEGIQEETLKREVKKVYERIKNNTYWYIYITPGGEIEQFGTSSKEDYKEKYLDILQISKENNGILIAN